MIFSPGPGAGPNSDDDTLRSTLEAGEALRQSNEQLRAVHTEGTWILEHDGRHDPHVSEPADSQQYKCADGGEQRPFRRRCVSTGEEPVGSDGDGRDNRGNQARVQIRQGHSRGSQDDHDGGRRRPPIQASP